MSDEDIMDTITEAIHGLRVMAPVGALNGGDTRDIAGLVIAALRGRYAFLELVNTHVVEADRLTALANADPNMGRIERAMHITEANNHLLRALITAAADAAEADQ